MLSGALLSRCRRDIRHLLAFAGELPGDVLQVFFALRGTRELSGHLGDRILRVAVQGKDLGKHGHNNQADKHGAKALEGHAAEEAADYEHDVFSFPLLYNMVLLSKAVSS
jgi:hypothetical protein